jgi:hypothetical protein
MSTTPFEHYDEAFAAEMIRAGDRATGLPDCLDIRTVDVGPGPAAPA